MRQSPREVRPTTSNTSNACAPYRSGSLLEGRHRRGNPCATRPRSSAPPSIKSLGHEPSQAFIPSLLETKLNVTTMFELQRHNQEHTDVPDYQELLDFLNLRAQAAEASTKRRRVPKPVSSMVISASIKNCISCRQERHQLYACTKFRSFSYAEKAELLRSKN